MADPCAPRREQLTMCQATPTTTTSTTTTTRATPEQVWAPNTSCSVARLTSEAGLAGRQVLVHAPHHLRAISTASKCKTHSAWPAAALAVIRGRRHPATSRKATTCSLSPSSLTLSLPHPLLLARAKSPERASASSSLRPAPFIRRSSPSGGESSPQPSAPSSPPLPPASPARR